MAFDPSPFRKHLIYSYWPGGHADEFELRVLTTDDGIFSDERTTTYTPTSGSAVLNAAPYMRGATMYLGHSDWHPTDTTHAQHISFASSTDGVTFAPLTRPDFTNVSPFGAAPMIWAGNWHDDGSDLHYYVGATPNGGDFEDLGLYYVTANDPDDLTQGFSAPTLLTGTQLTIYHAAGGLYDPHIIKDGTDYYLLCVRITNANPGLREMLTFKSTTGPFSGYDTLVNSGEWVAPYGPVDQPVIIDMNGEQFLYYQDYDTTKWVRQLTGNWKAGTATWSTPVALHPSGVDGIGPQVGAMNIIRTPEWTDTSVSPSAPSAAFDASTAGVTTRSPSLAVTVGDLVVLAIRGDGSAVITSITPGARVPSYTQIITEVSGDPHLFLYWGIATSTGTEAPTVTFNATETNVWALLVKSTPDASAAWTDDALVAREYGQGTGVTDIVARMISNAYAKELEITIVSQANYTTYTAGSGRTLISGVIGTGGNNFGGAQYKLRTTPAAQDVVHVTSGVTDRNAILVATFKSLATPVVGRRYVLIPS